MKTKIKKEVGERETKREVT